MQEYLPKQRLLDNEASQEAILNYVPDEGVKATMRSKWGAGPSFKQHCLHCMAFCRGMYPL